jgi:hypothetical protein
MVLCLAGLTTWISCSQPPQQPANERLSTGLNEALTSFDQQITSSISTLSLKPGQRTSIPVQIENPGSETWVTEGRYPVTISYKWFSGGQMLPIEGERTRLPGPVVPKGVINVPVDVIAPNQAGEFVVRITLVQEAVDWFMSKSGKYLELPASVK